MSLHAPGIKTLSPGDLSSDPSTSDSSSDIDEEDISVPTYSPITSDGSFSDLSSLESESENDEESSAEEGAGTASWIVLKARLSHATSVSPNSYMALILHSQQYCN